MLPVVLNIFTNPIYNTFGSSYGDRTRIAGLKNPNPKPLDEAAMIFCGPLYESPATGDIIRLKIRPMESPIISY